MGPPTPRAGFWDEPISSMATVRIMLAQVVTANFLDTRFQTNSTGWALPSCKGLAAKGTDIWLDSRVYVTHSINTPPFHFTACLTNLRRRWCRFKWSMRENLLLHTAHTYLLPADSVAC